MLGLETPTGQAVLACAVDFGGRAPAPRSLIARAPRRLSRATAEFWSERWRGCLPPPPDAELRAERLGRDVRRWHALQVDVDAVETQIAELLAQTPGQILTTLPGVAATRAAALAAFALPVERFPTPERLYSFTGLAPARYESATIRKARAISRTAPGERRDALTGIAWGLSQHCGPFKERDRELRARGMRPIEARVALARHACRLGPSHASNPTTLRRRALRSDSARARAVTAFRLCPARAQSSLPPARAGHSYGANKNLPRDGA